MTLLKTGLAFVLGGIALAVFGSRTELQAINGALTPRLKASIVSVLIGIALTVIGLRIGGQNLLRRLTGIHGGREW